MVREDNLVQSIRNIGHDIVNRVKDHEPLDSIEEDTLSRLVGLDECGLIISGYHRRMETTKKRNSLIKPNKNGQYMVVMNLVDGEENYFRGSKLYGTSLSLTSISSGEHFALVFDGLTGQVTEFGETTTCPGLKRINDQEGRPNQPCMTGREPRQVFGLGRLFPAGKESLKELEQASIRSLGSTTVSILEILRGHLDIYLNVTKIWNIWWALWLPSYHELLLEDLSTGLGIRSLIPNILSATESTIPLFCYRDIVIKKVFSSTLRDFSRYVQKEIS